MQPPRLIKQLKSISIHSVQLIIILITTSFLATQAEADTISGKVVDSNGNPLANVQVDAYYDSLPSDGHYPQGHLFTGNNFPKVTATTDNNGDFSIVAIPNFVYYLKFTGIAESEYYNNISTSKPHQANWIAFRQDITIDTVILGEDPEPVPPVNTVQSVPSLQEWGLILLIISLFSMSWLLSKPSK